MRAVVDSFQVGANQEGTTVPELAQLNGNEFSNNIDLMRKCSTRRIMPLAIIITIICPCAPRALSEDTLNGAPWNASRLPLRYAGM